MYRQTKIETLLARSRRGKPACVFWLIKILGVLLCQLVSAEETSATIDGKSYPRSERLAEASDLAPASLPAKRVILDTREKDKYLAGHVPTAIWVDAAEWGKAATQDNDAKNWTRRFTEVGIDPDSEVVVYDDQRLRGAARVWWILRLWGVSHPKVLNGGWDAYLESKNPIESGPIAVSKRGTIVAQLETKVLATKDQLLRIQSSAAQENSSAKLQLVDTRSKAEFCGVEPSRSKQVGTVPGAKNLEWSDLLIPNSARLKSPAELRALFAQAGIDPNQPTATFCQGGGRASVTALVLDVMGSPESRNYYRGWNEWGNSDDTPVAKGQ